MATSRIEDQLQDVAFLYLAMAHGTDNYLSDPELRAVTDVLHARCPEMARSDVQETVMEALTVYLEAENELAAATEVIAELKEQLTPEARALILEDLLQIARADGVVLDNERGLLASLADLWDLALPRAGAEQREPAPREDFWSTLHHLAFIYLVFAHSTDNDLSEQEVRMILQKLQEWQPQLGDEDVQAVLEAAKERYAHGPDEEVLAASVRIVKAALPEQQRMAALHDLVQIANADGIFLDDEEDMINHLMNSWEVAAYANYGDHGTKEGEGERGSGREGEGIA